MLRTIDQELIVIESFHEAVAVPPGASPLPASVVVFGIDFQGLRADPNSVLKLLIVMSDFCPDQQSGNFNFVGILRAVFCGFLAIILSGLGVTRLLGKHTASDKCLRGFGLLLQNLIEVPAGVIKFSKVQTDPSA